MAAESGASPQVVVVEDEPADAQLTSMVLESLGIEVVVLPDGDRAIELIESGKVLDGTLFLVDLHVPGRDGFQVLEAIARSRSEGRRLVAYGLSSVVFDADRDRALSLGATALLEKPGSLAGLEALAQQIHSELESLRAGRAPD